MNMKTIYSSPECLLLSFTEQTGVLVGSFNEGGASPYEKDDIFDNGNY